MYAYPSYRLNRSVAAPIIAAAAVIVALVAPVTLTSTTGAAAPTASAVVTTPAQQVDPAARAIAAQQHVTLAQAETRLSWQQAVPSLTAALSSRLSAASFGGIWIAPKDGDRVKVGVVDLTARVRANVMQAVRAVGLSGATDLVPVRYSLGQLVSADTWLAGQWDKLSARGGAIDLGVSYRTDLNRVQVSVARHILTAAERSLISRATAQYGDLVQVVKQPAGSATGTTLSFECLPLPHPYCEPSLRAGIYITSTDSAGATSQCTGGFIAASRTDGKLYEFTAGHCVAPPGSGYTFTGTWSTKFTDGSTHAIGTVHNYVLGASGDEAILNINNPSGWRLPQGWVYVMVGSNTTLNYEYPISSAQYSTVGARICETGAASDATICGTVLRLGVPVCEGPVLNCTPVNNLGEASFCGQEGDSGAPVYASHQAFGLVVFKAEDLLLGHTCVTDYQGIVGASNAMSVNIVAAHLPARVPGRQLELLHSARRRLTFTPATPCSPC